jgi:cob(I)alamin adenosyltransferase
MKIYTKKGDDGTTGLYGGARVDKDSSRLEAYGSLDELLAYFGLLQDEISNNYIVNRLIEIQHELFNMGAYMAATPDKSLKMPELNFELIKTLEDEMDDWNEELPPLKHFILPGGFKSASHTHVARTICRRVERNIVRIKGDFLQDEHILKFINRLSDWLFVLARYLNFENNIGEVKWEPKKS